MEKVKIDIDRYVQAIIEINEEIKEENIDDIKFDVLLEELNICVKQIKVFIEEFRKEKN